MEDQRFVQKENDFLAGCDEVGRGPLAGPVVAASFYLDIKKLNWKTSLNSLVSLGIDDSKKTSTLKRLAILKELGIDIDRVRPNQKYILKKSTLTNISFFVKEIQHDEIDQINILQASLKGMGESFKGLYVHQKKGTLLIDGHQKCRLDMDLVDELPLIKGDQRSVLIALSSIVAKEYRDLLMRKYAKKYPEYGFESHAGYPTKKHREAIQTYGVSKIHRKTFKGVKDFLPSL